MLAGLDCRWVSYVPVCLVRPQTAWARARLASRLTAVGRTGTQARQHRVWVPRGLAAQRAIGCEKP